VTLVLFNVWIVVPSCFDLLFPPLNGRSMYTRFKRSFGEKFYGEVSMYTRFKRSFGEKFYGEVLWTTKKKHSRLERVAKL
jgi:hypothetical protein